MDINSVTSATIKVSQGGKELTGKIEPLSAEEGFDNNNTTVVLSEDPDSEQQYIGNLGDLDGDGEITANDAFTILRSSIGLGGG